MFSCNNESNPIDITGNWSRTNSHVGKIIPPDNYFDGYLSSELFITNDSVYIINDGLSIKSSFTYEILDDSLILHFDHPIKYELETSDSTLKLKGKNKYYSYEITEQYQFHRSESSSNKISDLISEKINHHQLHSMNWSIKPNENLETLSPDGICSFVNYVDRIISDK